MIKHLFILLVLIISASAVRASGPVAHNDSASVQENSQVNIAVTANDTDANGGPLTVSLVTTPISGSATVNGIMVRYTPQSNFFGVDSFRYQITDTNHLSATAEVYIKVRGDNLPPVLVNQAYTFADSVNQASLSILTGDTDPGHDTLFIAAILNIDTTTNLGYFNIDSGSQFVAFTHTPLTCGSEVFSYVVCNIAKCDTAMLTINITCPDSIFLPQGFSPNGDGKNDFLVFPGLEYFSPASLNVFNRYGTTVYTNANYLNTWDGTDSDSHHPLPDGTYFYILTLSNGKTYNNYVIINR